MDFNNDHLWKLADSTEEDRAASFVEPSERRKNLQNLQPWKAFLFHTGSYEEKLKFTHLFLFYQCMLLVSAALFFHVYVSKT